MKNSLLKNNEVRTVLLFAALLLFGCDQENRQNSESSTPPAPLNYTDVSYQFTEEQAIFEDDLARRTFNYFWETTDPKTCLSLDRWPSAPFSSIASVGFELTAYGVGVERGFISREDAAKRTASCLEYYLNSTQGPGVSGVTGYKGFYYHFLDLVNGHRFANTELSSVDSSIFFMGVLFSQSFFDGENENEARIRKMADELYARADWSFFLRGESDKPAQNLVNSKGISMGWKPELGFEPYDWVGYDESLLVYILALGSPTHPLTKEAWDKGWAAKLEENWGTFYGQEHLGFPPLFGHQFSHIWIDFRGIQDQFMQSKGADYFNNSQRASVAQYLYAQDNPKNMTGLGGDIWGLTAGDGPGYREITDNVGSSRVYMGYRARGASHLEIIDDGTITPNGAGSSLPFTPEISIRALIAMKKQYPHAYGEYGFKDGFNPSFVFTEFQEVNGSVSAEYGWVARDYLGIGQGPLLTMLENHRTELVWRTMKKNKYIRVGLSNLGFEGGWLEQ